MCYLGNTTDERLFPDGISLGQLTSEQTNNSLSNSYFFHIQGLVRKENPCPRFRLISYNSLRPSGARSVGTREKWSNVGCSGSCQRLFSPAVRTLLLRHRRVLPGAQTEAVDVTWYLSGSVIGRWGQWCETTSIENRLVLNRNHVLLSECISFRPFPTSCRKIRDVMLSRWPRTDGVYVRLLRNQKIQ